MIVWNINNYKIFSFIIFEGNFYFIKMAKNYREHFEAMKTEIEEKARGVYRGFRKADPTLDTLALEIPSIDIEKLKHDENYNLSVWRGYTAYELVEFELGKLIELRSSGLNLSQQRRYKEIYEFFLGDKVIIDYVEALDGSNYEITEVLDVIVENFSPEVVSMMNTAGGLWKESHGH